MAWKDYYQYKERWDYGLYDGEYANRPWKEYYQYKERGDYGKEVDHGFHSKWLRREV